MTLAFRIKNHQQQVLQIFLHLNPKTIHVPRPELLRAFSNLQNIVKRNFEFFDEFNIPFIVSAFKFKYGEIEGLVNQVGVEGVVSDMNTPNEFKFKTGWLNVEYIDSTFAISVQDLIDECVRFIMGRRAQDNLFVDEE